MKATRGRPVLWMDGVTGRDVFKTPYTNGSSPPLQIREGIGDAGIATHYCCIEFPVLDNETYYNSYLWGDSPHDRRGVHPNSHLPRALLANKQEVEPWAISPVPIEKS